MNILYYPGLGHGDFLFRLFPQLVLAEAVSKATLNNPSNPNNPTRRSISSTRVVSGNIKGCVDPDPKAIRKVISAPSSPNNPNLIQRRTARVTTGMNISMKKSARAFGNTSCDMSTGQ